MISYREYRKLAEEGEPTTSVGDGGVDNPEGKKLGKMARRKCKDEKCKKRKGDLDVYKEP